MAKLYKILVTYDNGDSEFLKEGSHAAIFRSKSDAKEQVEFMKMGMGPEEGIQSISVVVATREVTCRSCDAAFTVTYNRSLETVGGIEFCPFCGVEGIENFEFEVIE